MSASPTSAPRRRRRVWLLVIGGVLALNVAAFLELLRDEPPPDLSDLAPAPRTLPPEDNAHLALIALAADVKAATGPAYDEARRRADYDDSAIPPADLAAIAAEIAPFLPRWRQIIAMPHGEAPLPRRLQDQSLDVGSMRNLWLLVTIHARHLAVSGRPDEALRELTAAAGATRHLTEAGGTLITSLTGIAMHGIAWAAVRDVIRSSPVSDAALRTALHDTANQRTLTPEGFATTLRTDFLFLSLWLDALKNDPDEAAVALELRPMMGPLAQLGLKRNQTLRWRAEELRQELTMVVAEPGTPIPPAPPKPARFWFWKVPSPDNPTGRALFDIFAPAAPKVLGTLNAQRASVSAHRAWIALILHEREHGELPPTLDALVPAYLDAVPIDYCDGAPIRYDRALRAVWSVGSQGTYAPPVEPPDPKTFGRDIDLRVPPLSAPAGREPPAPLPAPPVGDEPRP